MDGVEKREGVCTIAATNRVESLDSAVRSRFEEEIEFIMPDKDERLAILNSNISSFPVALECDVNIKLLAERTPGMSGRDLVEKVLKTALHAAIIEDSLVTNQHVDDAIKRVKGSNPFKNSDEGMFR